MIQQFATEAEAQAVPDGHIIHTPGAELPWAVLTGDDKPVNPPLIAECSPWQLRRKLNQLGLRAAVEGYVAASNDQDVKDGWEFASKYVSTDPFVLTASAALGLNPFELIAAASEIV